MDFKLESETLHHGTVKRRIMAPTYADALELMDDYVDQLDGVWIPLDVDNLPQTATFDELEAGKCGDYYNYAERCGRWHYLLTSGWFYTGEIGSKVGRLCSAMQKLDPVYF